MLGLSSSTCAEINTNGGYGIWGLVRCWISTKRNRWKYPPECLRGWRHPCLFTLPRGPVLRRCERQCRTIRMGRCPRASESNVTSEGMPQNLFWIVTGRLKPASRLPWKPINSISLKKRNPTSLTRASLRRCMWEGIVDAMEVTSESIGGANLSKGLGFPDASNHRRSSLFSLWTVKTRINTLVMA